MYFLSNISCLHRLSFTPVNILSKFFIFIIAFFYITFGNTNQALDLKVLKCFILNTKPFMTS